MTASSTDKNLPARNTLNVRLMRSKSVTRKLGDGYEKETAAIETDLPFGVDALQGLEQIADTLETHLSKGQTGQSPSTSKSPSTNSATSPRSPTPSPASPSSAPATPAENRPSSSLSLDEVEIQRATWKPQAKSGDWTFAHEVPRLKEALERADKQTLVAVGYRFKLWQDNEGTARISRWPHKTD